MVGDPFRCRRLAATLLLAAGCGESDAEVAAAMELALRDAHVAIAGALVADEALVHAHETPDTQLRHGTDECGCPCTERTGSPPSTFVLTLDYHEEACVPESGLLPSPLSGRAVLTGSGTAVDATLDAMVLGYEHALAGRIEGDVAPATLALDAAGTLSLGERALALDLSATHDAAGVTFDGEVEADGALVRLGAVALAPDAFAACPTPTAGTLVVTREGEEEVTVDLAAPMSVTRDGRISESVRWCAYGGGLW